MISIAMVQLLTYSPPLSNIHWFNHPGYLINKRNSSCDMVQYFDVSNLFPRHRQVLQQLQHSMRHVFQCPMVKHIEVHITHIFLPQVHSFVMAVFSASHITMVTDYLPHMFWWHVFFLSLHKPKLSLLAVPF